MKYKENNVCCEEKIETDKIKEWEKIKERFFFILKITTHDHSGKPTTYIPYMLLLLVHLGCRKGNTKTNLLLKLENTRDLS